MVFIAKYCHLTSTFAAGSLSSIGYKQKKILLVFRKYEYPKRCAQINFICRMTQIIHKNIVLCWPCTCSSCRALMKSDVNNCTVRQCSPLRRKFLECSINNPALSLLMKHLVIGQCQKAPNITAFHWSPHGSLVSIGQHFLTTRVVHLPKRTETSLITKLDQSGPNHQLLQLCTACTALSESDQAVRAVHSCDSWLTSGDVPFKRVYLIYHNILAFSFCTKLKSK